MLREAKTASGDLCDDFEIRKADLYVAAFVLRSGRFGGGGLCHPPPPPVLCKDCLARLACSYPSFG